MLQWHPGPNGFQDECGQTIRLRLTTSRLEGSTLGRMLSGYSLLQPAGCNGKKDRGCKAQGKYAHLAGHSRGRRGCSLLQIIVAVSEVQGPPAMPMRMRMGPPHPVLELVEQQHPQEARHQHRPDSPVRQRLVCTPAVLSQGMGSTVLAAMQIHHAGELPMLHRD